MKASRLASPSVYIKKKHCFLYKKDLLITFRFFSFALYKHLFFSFILCLTLLIIYVGCWPSEDVLAWFCVNHRDMFGYVRHVLFLLSYID